MQNENKPEKVSKGLDAVIGRVNEIRAERAANGQGVINSDEIKREARVKEIKQRGKEMIAGLIGEGEEPPNLAALKPRSEKQAKVKENLLEIFNCFRAGNYSKRGMLIIGDTGRGKTFYACSFLQSYIEWVCEYQRRTPKFFIPFNPLAITYRRLAENLIDKSLKLDDVPARRLVIIDEIRSTNFDTQQKSLLARQFLFEIVSQWERSRYVLILCTQFDWKELQAFMDDNAKSSQAIISRLRAKGHGEIIDDLADQRNVENRSKNETD